MRGRFDSRRSLRTCGGDGVSTAAPNPPIASRLIVAGSDSGKLQRRIYEKPLKNKAKTPYLLF
jgi:hypothetical protein